MSGNFPVKLTEILPSTKAVLAQMGVPKQAIIKENALHNVERALQIFAEQAAPVGLISEISQEKFAEIYSGQGQNSEDTPLEHIFSQASKLALFAFTLGSKISIKMADLAQSGDVALAGALDAAASVAADRGAEVCADQFQKSLAVVPTQAEAVLAYSPGYCGWHISGQQALFQALKPEQIGINLSTHFLMNPMKSVSGVLVAGEKSIQFFKPQWDFCKTCVSYSCLQRMKKLKE